MTKLEKEKFFKKVNSLRKIDDGWNRYFDRKDKHHHTIKKRIDWIFSNIIGPKILDVGCASGVTCALASTIDNIKEIYGIDICEKIIETAKKLNDNKKIKFSIGFAEDLEFKNDYFNSVIMGEVLEHVYDEKKAIEEAYRVLIPGGKIIITIPYKGRISKQHIRIFDIDDLNILTKLFKSSEFIIDVKRKKMFYVGIKK